MIGFELPIYDDWGKTMYNELFDKDRQKNMRNYFLNNLSKAGLIRTFSKNEVVDIDFENYFGIVVDGVVSINILSSKGNQKLLYVLRPGEIFGEMNYFCGGSTLTVAMVKQRARISIIHRDILEEELSKNPNIYRYFIHSITRKYRIIMLQLTNNVFNDSIGRIADALLRFASCSTGTNKEGKTILDTPFTHQELACNIGCSRITVTRCLNKFIDEGIITYEGKKIIVENPLALKQYIDVIEDES